MEVKRKADGVTDPTDRRTKPCRAEQPVVDSTEQNLEIDCSPIPQEGEDEDDQITYHVLEHIKPDADLNDRAEHWQHCIRKSNDVKQSYSSALAETNDCLCSVSIKCSELDWSAELSKAGAEAIRKQLGTQVPAEDYVWNKQVELQHASHELTEGLADQGLEHLYDIMDYSRAATSRWLAVKQITDNLGKQELEDLTENNKLFKIFLSKFEEAFPDPRRQVLKRVAAYHWIIKSDLLTLPHLFLI